jgi:hypothetical protein
MLLQIVRDPPIERRFVVNAGGHGELSSLEGVRFLEVSKAFP